MLAGYQICQQSSFLSKKGCWAADVLVYIGSILATDDDDIFETALFLLSWVMFGDLMSLWQWTEPHSM